MYQRSIKTKIRPAATKQWFNSRRLMVIFFLGVVVIAISLTKEVIRKIEIQREISSLESEIIELEQHNTELNNMMSYFNSSTFQEKEAKAKLNLSAPGETVVVLPNQAAEATVSLAQAGQSEIDQALPNYQKWFKYFFN